MFMVSTSVLWFIIIVACTLYGVLVKPGKVPDYIYALLGAGMLFTFRFVTMSGVGKALADSSDVIAFLIGMMLLSEVAADVGLFTLLADRALIASRGNGVALFAIVYGCGIVTTMLLSNDATAVVLTPSVILIARRANVDPIPLVLACAFVSNAASTLLPVSNPANLVLYSAHPPPLVSWLQTYLLPSIVSIVVTGLLLFLTQRQRLCERVEVGCNITETTTSMRIGMLGLAIIALALFVVSQAGLSLGLVTLVLALILVAILSLNDRARLQRCFHGVSWGVLVLVPALFVVAAAADHVGLTAYVRAGISTPFLHAAYIGPVLFTASITGLSVLANNLPVGLLTSHLFAGTMPSVLGMQTEYARRVALVAIDIGPNISTTASLATLLWLQILKKEKIEFSPLKFFGIGIIVLPLTLFATLAVLR